MIFNEHNYKMKMLMRFTEIYKINEYGDME